MSPPKTRNIGHSVFQRLLNHAKKRGENFNFVLLRYGVERLLYRLSISAHAGNFVLKGASLFLVWKGESYRPTKDADLLGFGRADLDHISTVFKDICLIPCKEDVITFLSETIRAVPIREDREYDGIQITLNERLL